MASKKDTTAVVKVEPSASLVKMFEQDTSLEAMKAQRIVPRLKVVQGLTNELMKDAVGEGGIVLAPGGFPVARKKEPIIVSPLFYFTEYVKWADRNDSNTPAVMARTFQMNSDIARRACDMQKRTERYGGSDDKPLNARYVEHLCFVCMLEATPDGSYAGELVTLSFEKGENMQGRSLINGCLMRRIGDTRVPLWAQRWQLTTALREKRGYKWWGFDFTAAEPAIIDEALAEERKRMFQELKEQFEARTLTVDRSDGHEAEAATSNDEM